MLKMAVFMLPGKHSKSISRHQNSSHMKGATNVALVCCAAAAVCLGVVLSGHLSSEGLLSKDSTQYWSAYYGHDAQPLPQYGSAQYTGYPSYSAMPVGRRPAYYNSDVNVEEAVGLGTNIERINFDSKEGQEAVSNMVDVIASIAFEKNIDKVSNEDRGKVTGLTHVPSSLPIPCLLSPLTVLPIAC